MNLRNLLLKAFQSSVTAAMDRKPVQDTTTCDTIGLQNISNIQVNTSIFDSNMKRSASEFALEEFLRSTMVMEFDNGDNQSSKKERIGEIRTTKRSRVCGESETDDFFDVHEEDKSFQDMFAGDVSFSFSYPDTLNGFLSDGGLQPEESLPLSQNLTPPNSSISATMDSQSSICAGSPTSAHKRKTGDNQGRGAMSGSSREQSDEDEREIEAGSCEQSIDPIYLRNIRRKDSNRESARRSRQKKQEHMTELESQVEKLSVAKISLFKQLADATQQFSSAASDNQVLQSDVEALRIQVKFAEDMVAGESLTYSLNHLLQNYSVPSQQPNTNNLCRVAEITPTIRVRRDEEPYTGMSVSTQISGIGLEKGDIQNGNIKNRLNGRIPAPLERIASLEQLQNNVWEAPEILPWEALMPPVSK